MGPMQRLVYIFEGKDELTPVGRKMATQMKKFGDEASKGFGAKLKAGLNTVGPMAASAIGVGFAFAIKEGLKVPMSQLKVALKDAGTSFDTMKPKIDATSDKMVNLGFGMDETYQSIINLTRATGNANLALKMQETVADLAKVKHIGLADASLMLARAADGSMKALKGMNITMISGANHSKALEAASAALADQVVHAGGLAKFAAIHHMTLAKAQQTATAAVHGSIGAYNEFGIAVLPKTATAAERLSQVQKVLNQRIGGTAVAASKTFAGKLNVVKTQFSDIAAKVGLKVLPVLSAFMSIIEKIVSFTPLLVTFAVAVGLIAAAWIAVKVASLVAAIGMKAAMISSGVGAAILLIVFLIMLIITHWKTVKKVAGEVWKFILDVMKGFWKWLKSNWPKILIILTGPFGLAAVFIIKHWDLIKTAAKKVFNFLRNTWNSLIKTMRSIFARFVDHLLGLFATILHGAVTMMGWVPGVGDKLKKASKAFDKFRQDVNDSLRGVNGRTVHVGVKFAAGHAAVLGPGGRMTLATGGPITGPGGDRADRAGLYALSNNEFVMQASSHKKYGTRTMNAINSGKAMVFPGMAAGGSPGLNIKTDIPSRKSIYSAIGKDIIQMAIYYAKTFMGSGSSLVNYARQFIGKVPYVWGGTTPSGWDCSGFTSYVYHHFGYPAPRTSQQQQVWARPSSDTPGALVFFYGHNGAATHVGLSMGNGKMINAYGTGFGTRIDPSHMSGFSGFGIPPGGFIRGGGGGIGGVGAGSAQEYVRSQAASRYGWTGENWMALYKLIMHESGWRVNARNPSSGASGLFQDITGTWGRGNLATQTAMGLRYIHNRYGDPWSAWHFWNSHIPHWYSKGGSVNAQSFDSGRGRLRPGYTLAYNGTGRDEYLSEGGGTTVIVNARAILGTKREVAKYVSEALREYKHSGGKVP